MLSSLGLNAIARKVTTGIFAIAVTFGSFSTCIADDTAMSAAQLRGQQIYRSGLSSSPAIRARLKGGALVSGRDFPCASCHGLDGDGRKEGGTIAPSLRWESLTAARLGDGFIGSRPAYTELSVRLAISSGMNSNGNSLSLVMPHFEMDDAQLADLVTYLKIIGSARESDEGLDSSTITMGSVLPMTGPLAPLGANVAFVLQSYFSRVNEEGGIYGRKLHLVVIDSQAKTSEGSADIEQLIAEQHVFAFIANYLPIGADIGQKLADAQIPLVVPVNFGLRSNQPNHYTFALLPSFADQAACLVTSVNELKNETAITANDFGSADAVSNHSHYAVFHGDGLLDMDAVSGMQAQFKKLGIAIPDFQFGYTNYSEERAQAFLTTNQPDYVFFFGAADKLRSVVASAIRANLPTQFLTTTAMAGDFYATAKGDALARVWFTPSFPANDNMSSALKSLGLPPGDNANNQLVLAAAFMAAEVLTEALKRGGRRMSRAKLIEGLETFRDYRSEFTPPITFGPNTRNGFSNCVLMRIDPNTRHYVQMSEHFTPETSQ